MVYRMRYPCHLTRSWSDALLSGDRKLWKRRSSNEQVNSVPFGKSMSTVIEVKGMAHGYATSFEAFVSLRDVAGLSFRVQLADPDKHTGDRIITRVSQLEDDFSGDLNTVLKGFGRKAKDVGTQCQGGVIHTPTF